jgi:shikimate dehydrogenase
MLGKDTELSTLCETHVIEMVGNPEKANLNAPKLAGIMGWPVEHSLSPRAHQFWLKTNKITGGYTKLAVKPENLAAELRALPERGFCGVNLTVPHKEAALGIVDRIDELARRVGAINTVIVRPGGKLEGRNTDVFGFSENLSKAGYKPNGPALILGAGGAARAATAALLDLGVKDIRIMNRTRAHAESLAGDFGLNVILHTWGDISALEDAHLLVNATSLGLKGQPPLEINIDALPKTAWITDMVYAPLETDLLKRGKARGNLCVDGLGMLLHQARPAFAAFFGRDPAVTSDLRAYVLEGLDN